MSDVVDFEDLGLVPGRRVTFTVDGERVVEDPPIVGNNPTSLGNVWVGETTPDLVEIARVLDQVDRVLREPPAGPHLLVDVTFMRGNPPYVPGCRCGCSDGKAVR